MRFIYIRNLMCFLQTFTSTKKHPLYQNIFINQIKKKEKKKNEFKHQITHSCLSQQKISWVSYKHTHHHWKSLFKSNNGQSAIKVCIINTQKIFYMCYMCVCVCAFVWKNENNGYFIIYSNLILNKQNSALFFFADAYNTHSNNIYNDIIYIYETIKKIVTSIIIIVPLYGFDDGKCLHLVVCVCVCVCVSMSKMNRNANVFLKKLYKESLQQQQKNLCSKVT